jgi:WD40 repeat protein
MQTPGAENRVEELLAACLDRDEAAWPAALEQACARHPDLEPELRRRVERLRRTGMLGDRPRRTRFGDYELIDILGAGASAVVHLALDRGGHPVALKILRARSAGSEAGRRRFEREARLAARVRHPSLCRVSAFGEFDGQPFLAMEVVDGPTLAARIVAPPEDEGELRARVHTVAAVARALAAAHAAGLVHRDVKPANVMVPRDGGLPVLMDLGLAFDTAADEGLTATDAVIGTPAYLAPELVDGSERGDARSDVYALGVTLHECVRGRLPFRAATRAGLFRKILAGDAEPLGGGVPADLRTVIGTAMARRPDERYPGAAALAEDLDRWLAGEAPLARQPGPLRRARRWIVRNVGASLTIAGLAAAVAITVLALLGARRAAADLRALALAFAAEQAITDDHDAALWLARAAFTARPSPDSRSALLRALAAHHRWRPAAGARPPDRDPGFEARPESRAVVRLGAAEIELAGHSQLVLCGVIAPDGGFAVTGSADLSARLWSLPGGTERASLRHPCAVHAVAIGPRGVLIATGGGDGVVRLFERLPDGQCTPVGDLRGHRGAIRAVRFSADGEWLSSWSEDETVREWSLQTGVPRLSSPDGAPLEAVAATEAGGLLLVGRGRKAAFDPDGPGPAPPTPLAELAGAWFVVDSSHTTVLASRAARQFVLAVDGASLGRLADGEAAFTYAATTAARSAIAVASGSEVRLLERSGEVWATVRSFRPLEDPEVRISALALAADGTVACGTEQGDVVVVGADGRPHAAARLHGERVWSVAFSGDGRQLVTASRDETAWLGPPTLTDGVRLRSHAGTVLWAAFRPGPGRPMVATGSVDGTARLWTTAGEPIAVLAGHRGQIERLCFSADGESLITASADHSARIWPLDDARLLERVDAVAPAELPPHALARYGALLDR